MGILTRAEEVGYIGAIGHFELGWFKQARRPLALISLETSRTLPGAFIGKGPVARIGDKATGFDPGLHRVLRDLAEKVLPGRWQRRLMDGGTCEATAALTYGLPAMGISIPLGNYHNQDFQGGPDSRGKDGPAPEFVHLDDVAGMITLCQALLRPGLPWANPWAAQKKTFQGWFRNARTLLRS